MGWRHFTPQRVMEMHSWYVMATHDVRKTLATAVTCRVAVGQSRMLHHVEVRGTPTSGEILSLFFSRGSVTCFDSRLSSCTPVTRKRELVADMLAGR